MALRKDRIPGLNKAIIMERIRKGHHAGQQRIAHGTAVSAQPQVTTDPSSFRAAKA